VRPSRRATLGAFVAGIALHTLAVFSVWQRWEPLYRGGVLTWIDLPVSLTYLQLRGPALLTASLLAGGLQWGGIAALLAYWLGSSLRGTRT
jgi:hypothetical protein